MASNVQKIIMGVVTLGMIVVQFMWKDPRVQMFASMMKLLFAVKRKGRNTKDQHSYVDVFESQVDSHPERIQFTIVETSETVTLRAMDELANRIAHWGLGKKFLQKDCVALMMLNHPSYLSIWLGLAKVGVACALINTNLSGKPLVHSVELALKNTSRKVCIVDVALKEQIANDVTALQSIGIEIYYWDHNTAATSLKNEVMQFEPTRPPRSCRNEITAMDSIIYIFTSGTTGMPKACRISHSRYGLAGLPYQYLCDLTPHDKIYLCLPLYHSAAGLICCSTAISSGASIVLRKKFSASNFTKDCLKYKVTSFQHIGELCRYLEAAPPNDEDKQLSIRTAFGNGLRPDCWEHFKNRYNIEKIVEFYGATEANIALFNSTGKVGALGYIPRIFDFLYPLKLIRTDPNDSGVPLRNKNGNCILCETGEVGLLINAIATKGARGRFEGYTDEKATNSKILRDVFKPGDAYFNSGDLMTRDAEGFYYWSDRTGDTFRWKGENVATTEVANILASVQGVDDVAVYGVCVPGCEGRAGMAALVGKQENQACASTGGIDINNLRKQCQLDLPGYAHPIFLRFKAKGHVLETTSTFKHLKAPLVRDHFNPSDCGEDQLFYLTKSGYEKLTVDVYEVIMAGKIKF